MANFISKVENDVDTSSLNGIRIQVSVFAPENSAVCAVEYIFNKKQASCHVIHSWAKLHARLAHLNRKFRRVDVTD